MKAGSVGWEFWIKLSKEEVLRLKNEILRCKFKAYDRENFLGEKDLELRVGDSDEQAFVKLFIFPKKVFYDKVEKYSVILSEDGYKMLRDEGYTEDRMHLNPGCNVRVEFKYFYY